MRRKTTRCRVLIERLSAYLDGDLGPAACASITRHARTCPRCAELIRTLQKTAGLCRKAGTRPLPAPVRARARAHIQKLLGSGT
jgi:anti-sigma factor RsiW